MHEEVFVVVGVVAVVVVVVVSAVVVVVMHGHVPWHQGICIGMSSIPVCVIICYSRSLS